MRTQSADGICVRFRGDPAQLQMIVDEMRAAASPVFMVAFGPVVESFRMFALESEGLDAALGALPCAEVAFIMASRLHPRSTQ